MRVTEAPEYVGYNQQEYYEVLSEVGGGGWNPTRNAKPWVRFCLVGHYRQAQTILRRTKEIERIYGESLNLVQDNGFPERTAMALLQAAFGRVRNSSYRVSADVSNNLASRDLKTLVDAGFLIPDGEKRGRFYLAGPRVEEIRRRFRLPRRNDDPFGPSGP